MDKLILWTLFAVGILLLILSFRKHPVKEWILIFAITGYLCSIFGVLIVEEGMLSYPVGIFPSYFDTSPLYEYLLLPVVCIYYYQSSFDSNWRGIIGQALIYSCLLTIFEKFLETYTNLIEYYTWTWVDSFFSIFFMMIFVRGTLKLINQNNQKE
ncbi:MAG TPA: CBO0543 family protein [Bacillales bacterium]|nr:CBO0543 family protein [Bacillales bacterium]